MLRNSWIYNRVYKYLFKSNTKVNSVLYENICECLTFLLKCLIFSYNPIYYVPVLVASLIQSAVRKEPVADIK